jgi:WD40 repeat protein
LALVAFAPTGNHLLGVWGGRLYAYDLTGKLLAESNGSGKRLVVSADPLRALAVDPAGEWVYVGGWHGTVYVFAADTLALRAAFEWHLGAVQGLAVSADGARLFSSGDDGCVKVWPIRDLMRGV